MKHSRGRQVVKEYEAGTKIFALREKYGIGSYETIKRWVRKYSREGIRTELMIIQTVEDQLEVKQMKARIAQLEQVLAQSTLDNHMLQTTLDVASEALGINLKKTFGKQ